MEKSKLFITTYMVDAGKRLRPSTFMELTQEIATVDARNLAFDDPRLIAAHNAVWVIAREKIVFHKMPQRYDTVELSTWHKGLDSIFFLRDYSMKSEDGESLIDATSSWVIMDLSERRALRPSAVTDIIPAEAQIEGHAIESSATKVVIPKTLALSPAGEHIVRYSDVDPNWHANNTRYISWAMDCLPRELTFEKPLREFEINFNREARPGEKVDLLMASDGDVYYVEGLAPDGLQVFICKLTF